MDYMNAEPQIVDLSIPGKTARWDVSAFTRIAIQVVPHTGTLSSGRLTIERSINSDEYVGMPSSATIGTIGIEEVDVADIAHLQVRVTTTQAAKVKIIAYMTDYQGA